MALARKLPVKKTQCASTHHSRKYTDRYKYNLPLPTHTHIMVRLDLRKCLLKKESFELGFEVGEGGEIPQAGRQRIPDSWGNENERTVANKFKTAFRDFQYYIHKRCTLVTATSGVASASGVLRLSKPDNMLSMRSQTRFPFVLVYNSNTCNYITKQSHGAVGIINIAVQLQHRVSADPFRCCSLCFRAMALGPFSFVGLSEPPLSLIHI